MRIGVVIPTYDQFATGEFFREMVVAIEELGYDSAWFGDHIVFPRELPSYLDPSWMEAVACAIHGLGMTTKLTFGTDVLVAPYRHPLVLAKMAATASVLSPGRLQLGLGIGWQEGEFELLGAPPFAKRGSVTEEYLEVIRIALEKQGPQTYHGEWIQFNDMQFEPKPAAAVPLLVGGNHANAIRRAALLGDGWHPLFMTPEEYASGRINIEKLREAKAITRPFIFSYSCSQTRLLEGSAQPLMTHSGDDTKNSSYSPGYPRAADGRVRFMGTPDELRNDCTVFASAGVDQLVIRFAVTRDTTVDCLTYEQQLRRFAEEVLPHCKSLDAASDFVRETQRRPTGGSLD